MCLRGAGTYAEHRTLKLRGRLVEHLVRDEEVRHRALPVTAVLEELVRRAEQAAVTRMTPAEERRYLRKFERA